MQIQVVTIEGCGSADATIALVKKVASEMDIDAQFAHVVAKTREEAATYRLIGSPTVLVNGRDIEPGARKSLFFGLT
jgi:hypothetical protein